MTITGLLAAIAAFLAVLAAVGVRVALSLKDIGTSLDRIAERMGEGARSAPAGTWTEAGTGAPAGAAAPSAGAAPEDSEIAAVIAAAARYAGGARARGDTDTKEERT